MGFLTFPIAIIIMICQTDMILTLEAIEQAKRSYDLNPKHFESCLTKQDLQQREKHVCKVIEKYKKTLEKNKCLKKCV